MTTQHFHTEISTEDTIVSMASNEESTRDSTQLIIEELKRVTKVTDQQLDTRIEQPDLPVLASYFENVNDGYLEAMNLSPGEQTDVRERAHVSGTLAGMILALTLWLNSQLRGTFRALIVILLSLGKRFVAVQIFKYLSNGDSTTSLSPPPTKRVELFSYKSYLQIYYKAMTLSSTTQWPPAPTNKVFELAMIKKKKIQRGKLDLHEELFELKIMGKIDSILSKKIPIKLENILSSIEDQRKFVLIEGASGSGKSTLALHICQEWAKGKLFQEFDIAILMRLRDPLIKKAKNIADILPCTNKAMAIEKETEIISLYGKGVLWVLDGWDELPSDLPQDSIINKLIQPGMSRESPLPGSAVIVTSRPSSSAELHPLISSRVEILGFTSHQLDQYFTNCLDGDSQAVQILLKRIRENPAVEGSCYLPLNAAIVVNCFLCDNHSLPISNHGIFKSFVQSSLKRYLQDKLGKTTPVGNITFPDSLPSELRSPFIQMCQLAYYGINQNKVTFSDQDLITLSTILKKILDIGLVNSVPSILGDGQLVYYCFLHLSIQELLAAIHISLMSPEDQISVFEKLFGQPRFSVVFKFYAGITKLKIKAEHEQTTKNNPTSILDVVEKFIKSECNSWCDVPKPLLLSLMHCLYEAEDFSLYAFVADLLHCKVTLNETTMNPIDCHTVGYFGSLTTKPFELKLKSCSINDQGCKFLAQGISKHPHSQCKLTLDLSYNEIYDEGIHHIAKLLTNTTSLSKISLNHNAVCNSGISTLCEALLTNTSLTHLNLNHCSLSHDHRVGRLLKTNTALQHLDLSYNAIGNTELSNLCDALITNTSLKTLNLSECSLTILDDNGPGPALCQLLKENSSLEEIRLYGNKVTSCRHLAAGLAVNKTLKNLNLACCELTNSSIKELSAGLIKNTNIEELYINGNDSITQGGITTFMRRLIPHCPKLKNLQIPSRFFSVLSRLRRTIYQEWEKNGLKEEVILPHWCI